MNYTQKRLLAGLLLFFSNLTFSWYEKPSEMFPDAADFREKNQALFEELEDAHAAAQKSPLYQQEKASHHNYENMQANKQVLSLPKAVWYVIKGPLSLQDIRHNHLTLQDFRMKCIESVQQREKTDPSYLNNYRDAGDCDTPECEFYRTMGQIWEKQEQSAFNEYIKASRKLDKSPEGKEYKKLRQRVRKEYVSQGFNQ